MGDFYAIKTTSAQTGGAYSITEIESFPGNGPPPHIHHKEDECFYIVEGAFTVILGERVFDVADGDFVRIPKGTPHTYKNVGAVPGKMLVILSPGGLERIWAELGHPGSLNQQPRKRIPPRSIGYLPWHPATASKSVHSRSTRLSISAHQHFISGQQSSPDRL